MKNIKDVCVLISARLNSHRIPKKMIAPFAGTTLLDVSLQTLLSSKVIPKENMILAVYEDELASIGEKYGINIYRRSEESSQSEGKDLTVLYDWHDKLDFKYVVMINLYASKLSLIKEGIWMGRAPFTKNNPVIFPIPEEECFDIDYSWQFNIAQAYYREKKNERI